MGATSSCCKLQGSYRQVSKASLEVYTDFQEALEKPSVAMQLQNRLVHTAARRFREICKNFKAFYKR
jgi:hypothetical protein